MSFSSSTDPKRKIPEGFAPTTQLVKRVKTPSERNEVVIRPNGTKGGALTQAVSISLSFFAQSKYCYMEFLAHWVTGSADVRITGTNYGVDWWVAGSNAALRNNMANSTILFLCFSVGRAFGMCTCILGC